MVEIIRPEFKRALKQKLRMLKARPELNRHPEFKTHRPEAAALVLVIAAILLFRRK